MTERLCYRIVMLAMLASALFMGAGILTGILWVADFIKGIL